MNDRRGNNASKSAKEQLRAWPRAKFDVLASSSTLNVGAGGALAARGGLSRSRSLSLCGCLVALVGELRGDGGLALLKPRCCSYSYCA